EALRKNNLLRHPVDREILATHVMGPGGRGKAPAQGLLDLRAKAERFFHPWAADPPITVEPHPRRLLLEVRRKVFEEDVFGDLPMVIRRDDLYVVRHGYMPGLLPDPISYRSFIQHERIL